MISVVHELGGRGRHLIDFELTPKEFELIGKVSVQWAFLEHLIYNSTVEIAQKANIPVPSDASHTSFKRRHKAWRLTIEECAPEPERARLLTIVSKAANLAQDRHRLMHGLWDWDDENPHQLRAWSFRPNLEFSKTFDVGRLDALADDIGAVNCEIRYPDGLVDFFRDYVDDDGRIAFADRSRLQALGLRGVIVRVPLDQDEATPPEDTPPQSSSKE